MPKRKQKVEVASEIIDGMYTIKLEDIGLTFSQLKEKIEKGKIESFTDKQKEYISQLIVKGYVQEMFRLKGINDFIIGLRTLGVVGAQNAIMVMKDIEKEVLSGDTEELPESYVNNTLQVLFVSKYLSKYGDKFDVSTQTQEEYEKAENIKKRYAFVSSLPGLVVDSLYGKIQEYNNAVSASISMDSIENF